MKVIFIQKTAYPQFSIMSLSAYLKSKGITTDVVINDIDSVRSISKNDVVAFTFTTSEYEWAYKRSSDFRKHTTVAGGPHATIYPEHAKNKFDYVVVGEGEEALYDLITSPSSSIPNVYPNPPRPLLDITKLPTPDRAVYYSKYPFLANQQVKSFITGRGCPYKCSFCANYLYQRLYSGQRLLRKRLVSQVIEEIKDVKAHYPLKHVSFDDDAFACDFNWLKEFSETYPSEVGLPFICNVAVPVINKEVISLLKKTGCHTVRLSIESADDFTQQVILSKYYTTKQIETAVKIIKSYDINIMTHSMLGLPNETLPQCWDTLRLNQSIKPTFAARSFCVPFPKYNIVETSGALPLNFSLKDLPPDIYASPVFLQNNPDKDRIINLQNFFTLLVKHPRLTPITKHLIKLPPNRLFRYISKHSYGYYLGKAHGYSLLQMVKLRKKLDLNSRDPI
jgi:radical SAM superfamily enzyme YgiQ (UPF0313 family)